MSKSGEKPDSTEPDLEGLSDLEVLQHLEKLTSVSAPGDSASRARAALELLRKASKGEADNLPASDQLADALGPELANKPELQRRLRSWIQPKAGTILGDRYELVELIDEGGMGSVWVAEQLKPVRRRVAIKLVKPGMDSRQVLNRFEAERQALAAMDHPNIAKILDGGLTDVQTPYFVMELVNGANLSKFCDEVRLGIRERLDLFTQISQGVQHAHQKGIIHRDLKPANILVTVIDGRPVPKIIDFGLAKALGRQLNGSSLMTNFGAVVGTLEYMSPEQAGYSGQDIDTRADIYSLGVILYEMLTGLRPFDDQRMQQAAFDEMLRVIKEEEPARPSARLSSSSSAPSCAALRQTEPKKLSNLLRSELDWIVMKSLEKERHRRYGTAIELAADVQRYLSGEPVTAHPPGVAYRFRKLVRKNRGTVIAAGLIAAALVTGMATTLWQANVAGREATRADERAAAAVFAETEQRRLALSEAVQRREAQAQREIAQAAAASESARAGELQKVADFQANMLSDINPTVAGQALMEDLTERLKMSLEESGVPVQDRAARLESFSADLKRVNATDIATEMIDQNILRPAIRTIETGFTDQPAVDASLRQSLALLYRALGQFDDALPLQRQALETRRRVLGNDHKGTITSVDELGLLLQYAGKLAESEPLAREALAQKRRIFGDEFIGTLIAMNNVGLLLRAQGKLAEAEPVFREALDKARRVLGEEHANTLDFMANLALVLHESGRPGDAAPLALEALKKRRRTLGVDHPSTLLAINNYALLLKSLNRMDEARPLFEECLATSRRILGEEHPQTLAAIHNLGFLLHGMGKTTEAEPYYRESMEKHRKVLGVDHPSSILALNNMASLLQTQGKLEEAGPLRHEVLERSRRVLGPDHGRTLVAIGNLAGFYEVSGKPELSEPLRREVLEKYRKSFGDAHADTLGGILDLANTLRLMKAHDPAEAYYREALTGFGKLRGPDHRLTGITRLRLGQNLLGQKRFADAELELIAAEKNLSSAEGVSPERRKESLQALVELYRDWDAAEPGLGHATRAADWQSKLDNLAPVPKK